MMDNTQKEVLTVIFTIVLICLFGLLFSLPIYWLWNECLVDAIDGVNRITWMQSYGITVLFNLMFRSSVSTNNTKTT